MSNGLPIAVINGKGRFGADKLAETLKENNIDVIEVGEFTGKLEDLAEKAEYYFDFETEADVWEKAEKDGAKLVIVGVNRSIEVPAELHNFRMNWRIINVHGVYGEKMETAAADAAASQKEIGYLIEAIKLAVGNKNLILPSRKRVLRLMPEKDLTEVVMRSCFLSGTEREVFEIWGGELNSEDLAKVLIDKAKMTRLKVEEDDKIETAAIKKEVAEGEWRKLRWRPGDDWAEGMEETMQSYFVRADEEGRKPKAVNIKPSIPTDKIKKIENKPRFEVEVEKEEKIPVEKFSKPSVKETEIEPEVGQIKSLEEILKEEFPEVEEREEIKPILAKNSYIRPLPPPMPVEIMVKEEREEKKPENRTENKTTRVDWIRWGWGGMAAVWGVILVAVIIWVTQVSAMYGNVGKIKKLISERKYDEAEKVIQKTKKIVDSQEIGVESWGWNRWIWGRRYQEVLKVTEQGMVLADKALELSKRSELIGQAVFEDKEIDWSRELAGLKNDLSESEDALGTAGARLSGDWRWVPARWRGGLNNLSNDLSRARVEAGWGMKLVDILPEILGTDGKRREFMVLLQNENELRPTGGFIGSYGILSFEGGKLINFEIKDIYQADGQLKGHVEPPQPIKDFLGEGGWYMRDANWQADFPGSAKDIQWFLEKETGRKVDGVIGINLAVAKSILGVLGEVYVPDFKEKINKDNLYEQAEFYSETNSFAGSDQKASFLGGLGKQLFESIKGLKGQEKLKLTGAILDDLERNELVMALNEPKAAAVVADLGWNGAIYQGRCPTGLGNSQSCFADYLYIVEANLGVNKTNYFLYRSVDETVDIGNQSIGRVVRISYENTAKSTNWPGGDYKNYLRVYIPKSANVAEVSSTNPAGGERTVYRGDSLTVKAVLDKKEVGLLVTVPIGQKRMVELRYVDQIDLSKKDKFSYMNYVQKQTGFGDTGLVALVSMPEGWQANQVEPEATLVNGKLLFNQKLERNIKMGIEIVK